MFDIFKKKRRSAQEIHPPIPLPRLSQERNNPVAIESLLKDGDAIWGWFKVNDLKYGKINFLAIQNITYGFDGIALFRKEGNYLVKYCINVLGEQLEICLRINEICKFSHSNIMELFNTELFNSFMIFYDEKQQFADRCKSYVHDLTEETIDNYLTHHRSMIIGKEHFLSEDSDLPETMYKE